MSRVGKKPISVPSGLTVEFDGRMIVVKNQKAKLSFAVPEEVDLKIDSGVIQLTPKAETGKARALWGTSRARIQNIMIGLTQGFQKRLTITGVGYKAAVAGANLQLSLGYSHDIVYPIPSDVMITAPKPTEILLSGVDSQRVGQVAAEIRDFRGPEPYKGKGIQYEGEFIFRKEGKKK